MSTATRKITTRSVTGWESNPFWFRTYTGRQFHLLALRSEDVDILHIAAALARIPRFGGHTRQPYTVAEHSVMVSRTEPTLAALLHDAAEACMGNMITLLKKAIPQFATIEREVQAAIAERFGTDTFCVPAISAP